MSTTEIILACLFVVYVGRVLFFVRGTMREHQRFDKAEKLFPPFTPSISILVPARNEERSLRKSIEALCAMTYPADKLQIIVVNDRSTDATAAIADELAREYPFVEVLHRTDADVDANLKGKPGALQMAAEAARGDILLMTDADCVVDESWALAMAAPFVSENVDFVTALTSVSGNSFFARVQDVEWTYTQTMACGGVGNGVPLGCFGNNLAIRSRAFFELGGYRSITFSVTEDLALQDAVFSTGKQLRYLVHSTSSVKTLPCTTLAEYVKQRHRWVRGGTGLGKRATFFVISSMALWVGAIVAVVNDYPAWFWLFVAARMFADGLLIASSATRLQRPKILPMILPAMLLLIATELVLPLLALKKNVTWKGQTFRPAR